MAGREQPYDPYIPSGGSGQGASAGYEGGNTRTAAIQSVRAHNLRYFDRACCAMGLKRWPLQGGGLMSTFPAGSESDAQK